MSDVINELFESRSFSEDRDGNKTLTRVFHVYVADPIEAAEYGPAIGEQYPGYPLYVASRSTDPVESSSPCVKLTVNYSSPKRGQAPSRNKTVWNTSISGEQQHIIAIDKNEDRIEVHTYDRAEFDKKVGKLIGKQHDGSIAGVDIPIVSASMSCTTWKRPSEITDDYKRLMYDVYATVNEEAFREWAAGEVLFNGVDIREISGELTELQFRFLCKRNKVISMAYDEPTTGAEMVEDVNKKGWHYLWKVVDMSAEVDAGVVDTNNGITYAIVVDKLFPSSDFSAFGLDKLGSLYV